MSDQLKMSSIPTSKDSPGATSSPESEDGTMPSNLRHGRKTERYGLQAHLARMSSAGDVGAPHLRRRLWMVADRNSERRKECRISRPFPLVGKPWRTTPRDAWGTIKSKTGRVVNGIPGRVEQVRALGNAIVPQVAAEFIMAYMRGSTPGEPEQVKEKT